MDRYEDIKEGVPLGQPVKGLGAGTHNVEVVHAGKLDSKFVLVFQRVDGLAWTEFFKEEPRVSLGDKGKLELGHSEGFVLWRTPDGRFQARNALTQEPLSPYLKDLTELYNRLKHLPPSRIIYKRFDHVHSARKTKPNPKSAPSV